MDPLNNNPATNEAPAAPAPEAAPVPAPAPEAPAVPAPAAAPAVNPDVANAALNPPVNPVVAPTAPVASGAAPVASAPVAPAPAAPGAPAPMSMNQMFQSQPVNQSGVLDETTAISVPEGPKPVDPVEEELKAPLKAAAPAPGSIGSAVSGPADAAAPTNVAFNDPAQAGGENPMTANAAPQAKKNSILSKLMAKTKMSKNTLILLAVVAGLIVVLLIAVLVMVATGAL